jgi:hypothetical protein
MTPHEIVFHHVMSTLPTDQPRAEVIINALTSMALGPLRQDDAVVYANALLIDPDVRARSATTLRDYLDGRRL